MLHYERIDISEGIDFDKSNKSVECMICHFGILKILDLNTNHMFVMGVKMIVHNRNFKSKMG